MIDNFGLYDIHERDQVRWEKKLPICDICKQPMTEWYRIPQKFGDLLVCTDCATKEEYEGE
mgnify:CR=1 FL=1